MLRVHLLSFVDCHCLELSGFMYNLTAFGFILTGKRYNVKKNPLVFSTKIKLCKCLDTFLGEMRHSAFNE